MLLGGLLTLLLLQWVPTDASWVQRHIVEASLEEIGDKLPEGFKEDTLIVHLGAGTNEHSAPGSQGLRSDKGANYPKAEYHLAK